MRGMRKMRELPTKRNRCGRGDADRASAFASGVSFLLFLVFLAVFLVCLAVGEYGRLAGCAAAIGILCLPALLLRTVGLKIPGAIRLLTCFLLFSSILLGEMGRCYLRYPVWDSVLHAISGMVLASVGFTLPHYLARGREAPAGLCAAFAFLLSLAAGTLWELFEFVCDRLLGCDMQKDGIIYRISSVHFLENPLRIDRITRTSVLTEDGQIYTVGGYLDIGLFDTMKDLAVGAAGALIFSVVGYLCLRYLPTHRITAELIPHVEIGKNAKSCRASAED
jgi:hypothetical protein